MAEDTIQNASDIPRPDRDEASGAALALIAGSFAAAYWGGRKPRPRTLATLLVGAVFIALSLALSLYETEVLQWLNRR